MQQGVWVPRRWRMRNTGVGNWSKSRPPDAGASITMAHEERQRWEWSKIGLPNASASIIRMGRRVTFIGHNLVSTVGRLELQRIDGKAFKKPKKGARPVQLHQSQDAVRRWKCSQGDRLFGKGSKFIGEARTGSQDCAAFCSRGFYFLIQRIWRKLHDTMIPGISTLGSLSEVNLFIVVFLPCNWSPILLALNPASLHNTCSYVGLIDRKIRSFLDICPSDAYFPPVRWRSFDSALYHGPARAYCSRSPAWELVEDPVPRLVFFLVCQQALLVQVWPLAVLARARTALLALTRISVVARLGITVAQTTIVIADRRLTPLRCKSPGINGSAPLRSGKQSTKSCHRMRARMRYAG
jgi:hypothetical protein